MSRPSKPRTYQIPMGLPADQLDEYARQMNLAERRKWYAEHPEDNMRHRVNSAIHLLKKHDVTCIPTPPAPPWTNAEIRVILGNLAVFMGYHGADVERAMNSVPLHNTTEKQTGID